MAVETQNLLTAWIQLRYPMSTKVLLSACPKCLMHYVFTVFTITSWRAFEEPACLWSGCQDALRACLSVWYVEFKRIV